MTTTIICIIHIMSVAIERDAAAWPPEAAAVTHI
jgi:hypothetical protein